MKATCSIADCDRTVIARTLCSSHYAKAKRAGTVKSMPTYVRPPRATCSEGCDEVVYGHGLCQACYWRMKRRGTTERYVRPPSAGYVDEDGYRRIYATGHPLASPDGRVFEHRVVAYAKYGPGEQSCHWCQRSLSWDDAKADHLDGVRLNNVPENIVTACGGCNSRRAMAGNPLDFKPPRRHA